MDEDEGGPKAQDFHWRFQKFNRGGNRIKSLTASELGRIRTAMHALPKGDLKASAVSLFGDSNSEPKLNNRASEENKTKRRIQELSVKRWMLDSARSYLLQDIEPQDITDLIENELYE